MSHSNARLLFPIFGDPNILRSKAAKPFPGHCHRHIGTEILIEAMFSRLTSNDHKEGDAFMRAIAGPGSLDGNHGVPGLGGNKRCG